jgi:hypothetical protein
MAASPIQLVGIFILLVVPTMMYLTLDDYMPFTMSTTSAAHENITDDTTSSLSIGGPNRMRIVLDWTKFFGSDHLSATWNVRLHNSLLQIFYSRPIVRCQITVHAHTPTVGHTFFERFLRTYKKNFVYRWSVRLYVHVKSVAACERGRRNMQ